MKPPLIPRLPVAIIAADGSKPQRAQVLVNAEDLERLEDAAREARAALRTWKACDPPLFAGDFPHVRALRTLEAYPADPPAE